MRRENQIRLLIALGLTLLLAISGTVAYFTASETAHNIVSTQGVNIEIYEYASPDGSKPFSELSNIATDVTYSKIPYVENIDIEPVWVRSKIILKRKIGDVETIIDDYFSLMEIGEKGENWTLADDGFYYYNSALSGGEKTEPLFKTVQFKDGLDNIYMDALFSLTVSAEATQSVNNGTSALNATWGESGGF